MSTLSRFGFTGDGDDERWRSSVEKLLEALVTNPHLNVGNTNSEVVFPLVNPPGKKSVGQASKSSFLATYNKEDGTITVGKGSYQYPIGTNVEVASVSGVGQYAYVCIKQVADGGLAGGTPVTIEIVSSTKDPINFDSENVFVEYSNVLLAEVVGTGEEAKIVPRRVGNLSLIYRLINGSFCLWPETTGGWSL